MCAWNAEVWEEEIQYIISACKYPIDRNQEYTGILFFSVFMHAFSLYCYNWRNEIIYKYVNKAGWVHPYPVEKLCGHARNTVNKFEKTSKEIQTGCDC